MLYRFFNINLFCIKQIKKYLIYKNNNEINIEISEFIENLFDLNNDYYLKLCGSGGGGYILGFTEDLEKAKASLKNYKLEVVYQF